MTFAKLINAYLHYKAMNIGLWGAPLNYPNIIHKTFFYTLSLSCIKIEVSPYITPLDLLT
jgi:hypothetical protein